MIQYKAVSEVTGSMNLISYHGLENAYAKYCGKKMKEELTSVLTLPGNINLSSADDNRCDSLGTQAIIFSIYHKYSSTSS